MILSAAFLPTSTSKPSATNDGRNVASAASLVMPWFTRESIEALTAVKAATTSATRERDG